MEPEPTVETLTIRLHTYINAAPEQIWKVFATIEGMQQWFPILDVYEPKVGWRILFHYPGYGEPRVQMYGEIVTFHSPRMLAFTWIQQPIGSDPWPAATLVTITLTPQGHRTLVTLEHSSFEQLPQEIARQQYEDYREGWVRDDDLGRLKRLVETGRA